MEKDEYEIIVWFDKKTHKYQVIRIKILDDTYVEFEKNLLTTNDKRRSLYEAYKLKNELYKTSTEYLEESKLWKIRLDVQQSNRI